MGKYAILAIMFAITLSMIIPAYADVVSFSTNKASYYKGEVITFKGKVEEGANTITIFITNPENKKSMISNFSNSNGDFQMVLGTESDIGKKVFTLNGIYNASAFLSATQTENEGKLISFNFSLSSPPTPPPKQTTTTQQQSSQSIQAKTDYKKEFLKHVNSKTDPQYYIDRYNNEELYKNWFDSNFPGLDIYEALGVSKTSPPKSEPSKTEPEPANNEPEPPTQEPTPTTEENSKLASFVDPKKDPQSYIDRYNNEPSYKAWFDKNYPGMTIYDAVGLEPPKVKKLASFVDPKKDPQSYIDRYNNEPSYKAWFDKSFPDMTIYEAVGVEPPKVGVCGPGTEFKDGICVAKVEPKKTSGGGCLIATAAYGTELAPQVQQLRELRDNTLLSTESGSTFMKGFNEFYYSFSPSIADMERQSPVFKEAVKLAITPMVSTLSILNYVDMDSEASVIGYGIAIISLNIGIYFLAPAIIVFRIKNYF